MLLTEETKKVINLAEIGRGSLISVKNKTWDKAQSGIVTEVTADTITVLFFRKRRISRIISRSRLRLLKKECGLSDILLTEWKR